MAKEGNYWQRRLTRRGVLRGAALGGAGLTAAALIGCGGDDEEPAATPAAGTAQPAASAAAAASATPAAAQPKRGGTLRRLFAGAPKVYFGGDMDPHKATAALAGYLPAFWQTVLRRNPKTLDTEPELAQKWEVVSPTEFVFTLAPNVKFHNKAPVNGRVMTADDVVFSFKRMQTNDPTFPHRLNFNTVETFEVVNPTTLSVKLKEPDATFLSSIAAYAAGVMAKEAVEKFEKFATAESVIGTGAFVLQSQEDTSAILARNPNYWKQGLPYLENVRLQALDQQAAWAALLAGQLDATWPVGEVKKIFNEQEGKDYAAGWFPDVSMAMAQPNVQRDPFKDPRVTKALRLLVDHQEVVTGWAEVFFGSGHMGTFLPTPLTLRGWDITEKDYQANYLEWKSPKDGAVKEALSLLSSAGFTTSNPLKFTLHGFSAPPFGVRMAELLEAQWRRLGQGAVQANIQTADVPTLNALRAQGEFDYFVTNIGVSIDFEADSWFRTMHRTGGGRNFGRHSDPTLDGMIDKQRALFNLDERKAASKQIAKYITENSPYTPWGSFDNLNAWRRPVKELPLESFTSVFGYAWESVWLDA